MMTLRLQIILLVLLAIGLAVIVNMVRKRVLELKYVLAWLFADLVLILFVVFPGMIGGLAGLLGIYSPMNMIFFLGFLLSLFILFTLTVALSKATASSRRMSQTIALLRKELEEVKELQENSPPADGQKGRPLTAEQASADARGNRS